MASLRKKQLVSLRQGKHKKIIFWFIFLVGLLLFLALIFRFYLGIKRSKINHLGRVNIVIDSEKIIFVSFGEKEISLLSLPGTETVRVSRGFGDYPLASVYQLGELEKKGEKLLSETIENFLGLPVEGIILNKRKLGCDLLGEASQRCLENILFRSMKSGSGSRFSFFDLLQLWFRSKTISKFNYRKYDLRNFSSQNWLDFVAKSFQDPKISKENLSIAILNGTEFPGLANQSLPIVTNLGGRVISLGNTSLKDKTVLVSSLANSRSYTLERLKNLFSGEWMVGEVEAGRADIGIYLGRDYWIKYNEKW